jgi:beta-galactosidase
MGTSQTRVRPVLGTRDATGRVTLRCDTAGARIEYSMNNVTWTPFTVPFEMNKAGLVSVRATMDGRAPFAGGISFGEPDHRFRWKVVADSSHEPNEGEPANVLDGNPGTFWHSRYNPDAARPPHHLVIDFSRSLNVSAVIYGARTDSANGRVRDYEIYLSEDGKQWGDPAAKGSMGRRPREETIRLPQPVRARFMKFVVLNEQTSQPFGAIAELDVIEATEGTSNLR